MNIEEIRKYCITKKGVEESFPFGEDTLVFKVMGKMFALLSLEKGSVINLKCNPDRAIELREHHSEIIPGFHMNKKHWNSVTFNQFLPDSLIYELVDHSYNLIAESLPKKVKESLNNL